MDDAFHERAILLPAGVTPVCPSCGMSMEAVDLQEDESGLFSVPAEARYLACEHCGALLDIGWTGWRWMHAGGL